MTIIFPQMNKQTSTGKVILTQLNVLELETVYLLVSSSNCILLLTLVMYYSARCPYHATARIFCIGRDSKLIYLVLRNMNFFKCFITGYMSPVQKSLQHSTWHATSMMVMHIKHTAKHSLTHPMPIKTSCHSH